MASEVMGGGVDVVFGGTEDMRAAEVIVVGDGMVVDGTAAITEGGPEAEEDMADTRLLRRDLDLRK